MVDLSLMKGLRVDPAAAVAVAEPGLTLGEFDAGTQAYGLATTTGVVSMTGLAGLTLGGGIGWLNGRYGLACDNLLEANVVTADGRLVTAGEADHADLFWALRGGGGNFGIVTSFRYRLHPVPVVLGGGVTFPPAQARDALRFCHDFARGAPDELSTAASISLDADGRPVVSVAVCYCGPIEQGVEVVGPLRRFGPPVMDAISPMSYTTLQSAADAGYPSGRQHYWKASFLPEITDNAIDVMLAFAADMPSPFTGIGLQELCGAASRVAPTATAFPHRAHHYDCLILAQWENPSDSARNIAWTRQLFEAMQPFLAGGVYANNLGAEENRPSGRRLRPELRPPRRRESHLRPRQPIPLEPQHHPGPVGAVSSSRRLPRASSKSPASSRRRRTSHQRRRFTASVCHRPDRSWTFGHRVESRYNGTFRVAQELLALRPAEPDDQVFARGGRSTGGGHRGPYFVQTLEGLSAL